MQSLVQLLRSSGALPQPHLGQSNHWRKDFFQLTFRNRPLGWIHKSFSPHLLSQQQQHAWFECDADTIRLRADVTQEEITQMTREFHAKRLFTGWRDELYSLRALDAGREELFYVERAFAKLFGLVRHSIHVNGFVRSENEMKMWMGLRAANKARFPGMWDNVVGGGLPRGMSPLECAVKECWEEASIAPEFARKHLRAVGALTRVCVEDQVYVSLEEIFVYDLDLGREAPPKPCDGEVERFELMSCDEVLRLGALGRVKPDVLLVVADFMLRHGLVPRPETDTDQIAYLDLVRAMHAPFPTASSSL